MEFFSYVLKALIEAAMAYGLSASRHLSAMLSRLRVENRVQRERLETVLTTKLVHLPMYAIDQFQIMFVFCRRRCGSRLAEVARFGCCHALVLLRKGRYVSNFKGEANAYSKIQSCGDLNRIHRLRWDLIGEA
jgi:hypothetical protein